MAARRGIFCLEGEWNRRLTDRRSVAPLLQLIEKLNIWAPPIHKNVATKGDFEYYARQWCRQQYAEYPVGYFSFHGEPGRIRLGRDKLRLDEMADMLRSTLGNRVVYFGSCSTLAVPDEDLQRFCRLTGAKAVVGYVNDIDWLESAAFDLILLPRLLASTYIRPIYNGLSKEHPRFVEGLGLRMASSSWVTPRRIRLPIVEQRRPPNVVPR